VSTGSPPPPVMSSAEMAHLRIIHASPDPLAANVAVYVDNASSATGTVQYRNAAGYLDLPSGTHSVAVRPAAAPSSTPPAMQASTPALQANHYYTVIAHGLTSGTPGLAVAAAQDENTQPASGQASLRFFHAIAGMNTVDICAPGPNPRAPGVPVFAGVSYGAWGQAVTGRGSYATVPAGQNVRLQVRGRSSPPCRGAVLGTLAATAPDRAVVTSVAIGNVTANPPVQPEMLVCIDAPLSGPSTCAPVPIAGH
jgi:hypothetical protein